MKELDKVEVIRNCERYAKNGIVKGMIGTILHPECVDGRWLVYFSDSAGNDTISDSIKESDLKVVGTWGKAEVKNPQLRN